MTARCCGFHEAETDAGVAARYVFQMPDGREFPDSASRFQPQGVHGPSEIVDTAEFEWTDHGFVSCTLSETIIYELHVGTFTPEGTFAAAIPRLQGLAELRVTAVELRPVGQFPGSRNCGYDGVFPYAVQNSYGGPRELQRFVDAAHALGISVILDVVYNHLGPEGNYLSQYGAFFTKRYSTPWGEAINFDGASSDPLRAFFIENALHRLREFHIDALRLDALHGILDFGARHFLAELKEKVVFVAFDQNHNQVGNRALGERLSTLVELDSLRLAAGVTLLIPHELSRQNVILSSTRPQSAGHPAGGTPSGGAPGKMHVARRSVTVLTSKAGQLP